MRAKFLIGIALSLRTQQPPCLYLILFVIATLASSWTTTLGLAQTPRQWKCIGDQDITLDEQIAGCTNAIKSGKYIGRNLAWAYLNRGNARQDKRDLDGAIADYDQAIRLDPKYAFAYGNRGNARKAKGDLLMARSPGNSRLSEDYYQAILDFNQAIQLDPQNALVYNGRGNVYAAEGDLDRASADYTQAIQLDPKLALAYTNRGNVRLIQWQCPLGGARNCARDLDGAIADYSQAIQIDPKYADAYRNRARAYEQKNDIVHARADFDAAQRLATLSITPTPSRIDSVNPSPPVPSPPAVGALTGKRVALVIGNSSYINVPRLVNPANDARLTADTLRSLGFTLVGGGAQLDLDKGGIDRVVRAFGAQLQGADVGLFYYAGHGVQVSGANYLIPVDANPVRQSDVDFQMLDANLVLRQMADSGTKLNLVILDACRNNPFGGRGLRGTTAGLAQMQAPEGTLISFATQPGNVAQDGNNGHSPYTEALTQVMKKPGFKVFDTFNEVGLLVSSATGGAQQPWFSTSPIKGDFYFAGR